MITIAWDVDDVLNDLMRVWFEREWLPKHNDCRLTYDDISDNPPHELLEVSLNQYRSSLDSFRLSPAFQELIPIPEVVDWFMKHGDKCHHIALTAVPLNAAHASAQWLFKYYGRWLRSFHFVPTGREGQVYPAYDKDKAAYLARLGSVAVFVEDNEDNLQDAEKHGIKSIIVPRPWNSGEGAITEALALLTKTISLI